MNSLYNAIIITFFSSVLMGNAYSAAPGATTLAIPEKKALMKFLKDSRVKAFLDVLAYGEGTLSHALVKQEADQYRISYCNNGKISSLGDHPRQKCCYPLQGKMLCSTAAGRYMFLQRTWDWIAKELDLHDFSPLNQDLAAVFLLIDAGALNEILKNDVYAAIRKASRFWAPMPGDLYHYNQPQKKVPELVDVYNKRLAMYKTFPAIKDIVKG